jgi:ATP-binding cassette subfamily B protein
MKLSGGEQQRLMIAAAAMKRPRFMIVDEATSSLDAESQAAVQAGIDRVLEGESGAIIIAHRLSTVLRCDTFVVLRPIGDVKDGESQVEAIAHSIEELWRISPTFRKLAELEGVRIAA